MRTKDLEIGELYKIAGKNTKPMVYIGSEVVSQPLSPRSVVCYKFLCDKEMKKYFWYPGEVFLLKKIM